MNIKIIKITMRNINTNHTQSLARINPCYIALYFKFIIHVKDYLITYTCNISL